MANMFSFEEKEIPRNLDECKQTDPTSRQLLKAAEWVENIGMIVLGIIILIGVSGVIAAVAIVFKISEDLIVLVVVVSCAITGIIAYLWFVVYRLAALLLGAYASITQNTRISANVALYAASQNMPSTAPATPQKPSVTPVPEQPFGRNPNHIPQPQTVYPPHAVPVSHVPHEIYCPFCGTKQRADRKTCVACNRELIIN